MKAIGVFLVGICLLIPFGCNSESVVDVGGSTGEVASQGTGTVPNQNASESNLELLSQAKAQWKAVKPNSELAGKIDIDGSSTVYPITEAAAAAFKKIYPNVNVTVGKSGTGGGFKRFTSGETDISDASRPIKPKELKGCQQNSVSFIEIPVAYDGLTVVVRKDNDFVEELTIDQLKSIFLSDKAAKTLQEINPQWPDEEIKIHAPGTDSGTFDYFKEVIAGKDGAIRSDMSTSENDDVLVNGVAGDKYSIGFFGAAYYFQNTDKLKAVKIVNPTTNEAVAPSDKTIENGSYAPFSRPLFIYLNAKSVNKAQVEKFVDFYLASADEFARAVKYVALPTKVYAQAYGNYLDENVGTHYLDGNMEKRSGPVTEVYTPENLTK